MKSAALNVWCIRWLAQKNFALSWKKKTLKNFTIGFQVFQNLTLDFFSKIWYNKGVPREQKIICAGWTAVH